MDKELRKITGTETHYRLRILGTIAIAELVLLGLFTLWPEQSRNGTYQDISFSDDPITFEDVQITRQSSSPPPPPKPQVPIPVPNDQVVEEQIDIQNVDISDYSDFAIHGRGQSNEGNQISANPEISPSLVRIVEPTVPEAAKKAEIKAEIWVSFLVDKEGRVEEATISRIKLYNKDKKGTETVDHIGYGLEEATLEAALQWKFRPAQNNGKPVRAYTKHIFTYGF